MDSAVRPLLLVLVGVSFGSVLLAVLLTVLAPDSLTRRIRRLGLSRAEARDHVAAARAASVVARLSAVIEALGIRAGWIPADMMRRFRRAGYYHHDAPAVFVLAKLVGPLLLLPLAWAYMDLVMGARLAPLAVVVLAAVPSGLMFWAPDVWVKNVTMRRQTRIERGWPDSLDLLHLCMSAGMGLEAALAKVAQEIRPSYPDIADELMLTMSELAYLQERRRALENLAERTDVRSVREVVTALIQSERYGTALGETLQILARENRAQRLAEAEKKAAALPPKLTVPMIVFFLPALFVIIGAPAIIRLAGLQ